MCRNIKMLFNFDPPVTPDEVRAASLQYVRKVSGFNKPSKANEPAFNAAIEEIAAASMRLLTELETLPELDRALVELVDLTGLPPKEAASALGISRGAARTRLMRARTRLRKTIRDPSQETS